MQDSSVCQRAREYLYGVRYIRRTQRGVQTRDVRRFSVDCKL